MITNILHNLLNEMKNPLRQTALESFLWTLSKISKDFMNDEVLGMTFPLLPDLSSLIFEVK